MRKTAAKVEGVVTGCMRALAMVSAYFGSAGRAEDAAPPDELLDVEGEGIYLRHDLSFLLNYAAALLLGDAREWRRVQQETAYFRPTGGDEWRHVSTGRHPRGWRLKLPARWRPVMYVYCTPEPDA